VISHPYAVELIHDLVYDFIIGRCDPHFKITSCIRLRTHSRTREVRAPHVGRRGVYHHALEMHPGAQDSFHPVNERRIFVKVRTKSPARFLGMNEADLNAPLCAIGENLEKRHHPALFRNIKIFHVRGPNPDKTLRPGYFLQYYLVVNVAVGNELYCFHKEGLPCGKRGKNAIPAENLPFPAGIPDN
jgi:hypothetical protein